MVNSKIIQTWNYLKANRGIIETLHTFQKSPPSFNGGDSLTHSEVKPTGHIYMPVAD